MTESMNNGSNIVSLSPEHLSKLNEIKPTDIQIHMKNEIEIKPEHTKAKQLLDGFYADIQGLRSFCEENKITIPQNAAPHLVLEQWLGSQIFNQVKFE